MLLQTLVIVLLSTWIVEEYLNNIYLQAYVNNVVQANGSLIAISVVLCALGLAFGLLRVLRSTHRQLGALVNQPTAPGLTASPTVSSSAGSSSTSATDLHPMVAALKAELAHQGSMQPLPPIEVKEAAPAVPVQVPPPPPPPPPKPMTGTPSTVITGTMPVLKRVNPDRDRNQGASQ